MNYYERHIGDYLKDTAHLSLLEHGIYTRLLDVYYTREAGIPESDAARLIGARSKDEKEALQAVLAEFFVLDAAVYRQARADREIEAYREGDEDRDHKRDNAKERQRRTRERRRVLFATLKEHGVVPDWNTPVHALEAELSRVTKTNSSAPVTPPVTRDATATHTQSHTQKKDNSLPRLDGFAEFWAAYPRKVSKADAEKAWRKLGHINGLLPTILAAVEAQSRSEAWMKDRGEFIPYPATWLNGKRWEDVLTTPKSGGTPEWVR